MHKQLEKISQLGDNWNGYKTKAFSKEHIELVQKIIDNLKFEVDIYPTASNSIQIEYTHNNRYCEYEIYDDGTSEFYSEEIKYI